jgi:hypothetical protein
MANPKADLAHRARVLQCTKAEEQINALVKKESELGSYVNGIVLGSVKWTAMTRL